MTIALTRVKDIGPMAAELLAKHGIGSVEVLASLSPAQLAEVPGFGLLRSERVIASAKSLLATAEAAGMDLGARAGPLKSPGGGAGAVKKGKDKDGKKKGKGKSRAKADRAGKGSKKGKGGKNRDKKKRDKGDSKKSAQKKGAKKKDKKHKKKKSKKSR